MKRMAIVMDQAYKALHIDGNKEREWIQLFKIVDAKLSIFNRVIHTC